MRPQPSDRLIPRDVGQLKVHQDQVGLLIAGEGNPLDAPSGTNGFVTMSLKDIPQELHIERVVLDDQDPLGCRSRVRKGFYQFENSRALQQRIGWYPAGG
jgi:hypothetical protein